MLLTLPYARDRAVQYAKQWALSRNPLFSDFTGRGGNCTNFVSQCVFAGCGIMNYTPTFGWYYVSETDRAPAWTGVEAFFDFLTDAPDFIAANGDVGPFGTTVTNRRQIALGDVVQLADSQENYYHTLIITGAQGRDILVSAQSDDALDRPLSTYNYASLRIIHIEGAKIEVPDYDSLADGVFNATALPSPPSGPLPPMMAT